MTARRLRTALPALFLPLALLAGCDGGSGGPDSADDSSASSPGSSASEPDVPSASPTAAGELKSPCDAVDQAQIAKIMGLKKIEGNPVGDEGVGTLVCTFFDTEHLNAPLLTLQTSEGDQYDQFISLTQGDLGNPEPIDVPGAEEAAVLVDDDPDLPGVTVVAHTPGRLQVVTVGDKTVEAARKLGVEAITLLVAGNS